MTSKQEHAVVQFRHFPFQCLLASRVESPSKSFENLKEMPTRCVAAGCGNVKILKRVYRCILYHITVMNDQNRKEEGRDGSTL